MHKLVQLVIFQYNVKSIQITALRIYYPFQNYTPYKINKTSLSQNILKEPTNN